MRGMRYLGGLAVLGSALAALAWAQTGGTLPPTMEQPPQEGTLPPTSGPISSPIVPVQPPSQPPIQPPVGAALTPPIHQPTPAVSERMSERMAERGTPRNATGTPAVSVGAAEENENNQQGVNTENPTGRQEPAVSVEWVGPPAIKVGRPADFTVVVKNVCNISVQQVMVRVRVPNGMTVNTTEPKAIAEGNVLMWELGTMGPKQEKNLQVRMIPDGRGSLRAQAWVTFTGSSVMPIKVVEPKLVLKAQAPEKVMVGDAATFILTVTNPGDGPADQVRIHAELSDGLEHVRGKKVDFEIGNLAAGESRSVQLICATKQGGIQTCDALAEAEGDLRSQDKASVNVIMPRLVLEASGPKLRYLERKAKYVFKVTNPGDASATNVTVHDVIPAGFKYLNASDGGRHDFSTRTVTWFLGELGPSQSKTVELDCVAINPGEWHHTAAAQAARGLKENGEVITKVEGLAAIMVEMVDTEDPIEVGADTSYEIRITNTGSKTDTNIKLVCTVPELMQFKGAQGPVRFQEQGKEVVFEPLGKLAPKADAIFRVTVKALAVGSVRFKSQITSDNLVEPVMETEATKIYGD